MEKKKEKGALSDLYLVRIVSSNTFAYVMFALALIACFYTIYNVEDYQQKVNNHWMSYIDQECFCMESETNDIPDVEFEWQTPKDMIDNYGEPAYNTTIGGIQEWK